MGLRLLRIATLVGTCGLVPAGVVVSGCGKSDSAGASAAAGTGSASASAPAGSVAPPASASASAAPSATGVFNPDAVQYVTNPYKLPPYDGPTGSVEGTVTVEGPASPDVTLDSSKCPAAIDTYGKLFREGTPTRPGGPRPIADAVVVITPAPAAHPDGDASVADPYVPEKNPAVPITIGANCGYATRTIAITYGQRLEIVNQSTKLFAPTIDEISTPATMVAPPRQAGDAIKIYPQRAGYFQMRDTLEPFVKEDLYVFRHPLHAVTNRGGYFRIDGVPVGSVQVGVYHPGAKATAQVSVAVTAGTSQKADVKLTYKPSAPPKPIPTVFPPGRHPND